MRLVPWRSNWTRSPALRRSDPDTTRRDPVLGPDRAWSCRCRSLWTVVVITFSPCAGIGRYGAAVCGRRDGPGPARPERSTIVRRLRVFFCVGTPALPPSGSPGTPGRCVRVRTPTCRARGTARCDRHRAGVPRVPRRHSPGWSSRDRPVRCCVETTQSLVLPQEVEDHPTVTQKIRKANNYTKYSFQSFRQSRQISGTLSRSNKTAPRGCAQTSHMTPCRILV